MALRKRGSCIRCRRAKHINQIPLCQLAVLCNFDEVYTHTCAIQICEGGHVKWDARLSSHEVSILQGMLKAAYL